MNECDLDELKTVRLKEALELMKSPKGWNLSSNRYISPYAEMGDFRVSSCGSIAYKGIVVFESMKSFLFFFSPSEEELKAVKEKEATRQKDPVVKEIAEFFKRCNEHVAEKERKRQCEMLMDKNSPSKKRDSRK